MDISSLFNCAFGLVSNERREGYDFLLQSIESIRAEIGAAQPQVTITDFQHALRSAITAVWPDTQLQLCIFHIHANVKMNAKNKWKGLGSIPDGDFDVNRDKETAEAAAIQEAVGNSGPVGCCELPATAVGHLLASMGCGNTSSTLIWKKILTEDNNDDGTCQVSNVRTVKTSPLMDRGHVSRASTR